MNRSGPIVALLVVVGTLVVPAAGVVAQDESRSNDEVAPGERLSGVVGVQAAELEGEIETRAYEAEIEAAESDDERAERVAERTEQLDERLADLREERAELLEERREGELTEGEYRAEIAALEAETDTVQAQLNETNETAAGLPEETLAANGVNATAIRTLGQEADNLSGAEVSALARSIAGNETGEVDVEVAVQRGNGVVEVEVERENGEREVETEFEGEPDNASEAVALAETRVAFAEERLNDSGNASELADARATLEAANAALENGSEERALELAEEASETAEEAVEEREDEREEEAEDEREDEEAEGEERDDKAENEPGEDDREQMEEEETDGDAGDDEGNEADEEADEGGGEPEDGGDDADEETET